MSELAEAIERYSAWTKWADENREPGVLLWPYDGCTADAVKIASAFVRGQCDLLRQIKNCKHSSCDCGVPDEVFEQIDEVIK